MTLSEFAAIGRLSGVHDARKMYCTTEGNEATHSFRPGSHK